MMISGSRPVRTSPIQELWGARLGSKIGGATSPLAAAAEVEAQIAGADSKARLEDVYLPFKPKRRTKAQPAPEAGLGPRAELTA